MAPPPHLLETSLFLAPLPEVCGCFALMVVFCNSAATGACKRTRGCVYVLRERLDVKQLNDASILIYIPLLPERCLNFPT